MWIDVAQTVFDGLMVGGLYATVAVGITLVFGIMGVLNFAHGQMVMLGAYVAFFAVTAGLGIYRGSSRPSALLLPKKKQVIKVLILLAKASLAPR